MITGGGFIPIILYATYFEGPSPPPGTNFMISEISSSQMITETNDQMVTE